MKKSIQQLNLFISMVLMNLIVFLLARVGWLDKCSDVCCSVWEMAAITNYYVGIPVIAGRDAPEQRPQRVTANRDRGWTTGLMLSNNLGTFWLETMNRFDLTITL